MERSPTRPDNKSTADDLGFVEALINQLNIDYLIDQDRIYTCGFSNGGMMKHALACYSDLIAAIGSISGVMLDTSGSCTPNRAVPVIKLHGTADPVLPFNGDVNWNSAQSAIDFWVTNNQTNTTPEESTYNTIERYHYTEGNNGTAVDFYKIINGEHFGLIWSSKAKIQQIFYGNSLIYMTVMAYDKAIIKENTSFYFSIFCMRFEHQNVMMAL